MPRSFNHTGETYVSKTLTLEVDAAQQIKKNAFGANFVQHDLDRLVGLNPKLWQDIRKLVTGEVELDDGQYTEYPVMVRGGEHTVSRRGNDLFYDNRRLVLLRCRDLGSTYKELMATLEKRDHTCVPEPVLDVLATHRHMLPQSWRVSADKHEIYIGFIATRDDVKQYVTGFADEGAGPRITEWEAFDDTRFEKYDFIVVLEPAK